MTTAKPTTEVVETNVHAEMAINKQDIVDVAIARAERQLRKSLNDEKVLIKNLEDDLLELVKKGEQIKNSLKFEPGEQVKNSARTMIDDIEWREKRENGLNITKYVHVEYTERAEENSVAVSLVCEPTVRTGKQSATLAMFHFPLTDEQLTSRKDRQVCEDAIQSAEIRAIKLKKQLSQLDIVERQMKAKIVELQLEKTTSGKELLDALSDMTSINETIKLIN